jgi:hypothetical protein
VYSRYSLPAIFFFEPFHQTVSRSTNTKVQDTYKLPQAITPWYMRNGRATPKLSASVMLRLVNRNVFSRFSHAMSHCKETMIQKEKD